MDMKPPNKKLHWRRDYRYRVDDRETFRAEIVSEYPDDSPIRLTKFVAWLHTIWHSIPEELRQDAFLKLGHESDYDTRAAFDVYLERPETDEEFSARKAKDAAEEEKAAKAQEARERGMLEALKKKYGQ